MRNGQNKRMRGRNRPKGPNPLSRSYESNGPDIKIRGTAQHVAEKYLQLARDAQASGDPVMAESYLQHAEHYFRIIMAAQEQFRQQAGFLPGDQAADDDGVDEDDDEPISGLDRRFESRPELYRQERPQQQGGFNPNQQQNQYQNQQRFDRNQRFDRGPRPPMGDPNGGEQPDVGGPPMLEGEGGEQGGERQARPPRFEGRRDRFRDRGPRGDRQENHDAPQAADGDAAPALPAFITGGVGGAAAAPEAAGEDETGRFPLRRPRRRRFERDSDAPAEAGGGDA